MPAASPTCSSTRCSAAFCITCAASRPPFASIDTHAGAGLYDLGGTEASRGGEWHDGIERLLAAPLAAPVAELLAPYLEVVGALNERGRLKIYPGSPALARAWLRPQDRLIACELEPQAAAALGRNLQGDARIKTLGIDGWTALAAYVPPKERRGLVLVDPPFEQDSDFVLLSRGLGHAYRKWATGIYALWYPIKGRSEPDALAKRLRRLAIPKILRAESTVAPLSDPTRLGGSGLILVNPPFPLESELSVSAAGAGRGAGPRRQRRLQARLAGARGAKARWYKG